MPTAGRLDKVSQLFSWHREIILILKNWPMFLRLTPFFHNPRAILKLQDGPDLIWSSVCTFKICVLWVWHPGVNLNHSCLGKRSGDVWIHGVVAAIFKMVQTTLTGIPRHRIERSPTRATVWGSQIKLVWVFGTELSNGQSGIRVSVPNRQFWLSAQAYLKK